MIKISSRSTFFSKKVFPVIWFGFLVFFIIIALAGMAAKSEMIAPLLIMPVFMAIFGYVIMKKLVFDLADEVWDTGDALLVKNKNEEELIPLTNIINVSYSVMVNPPRVTLTLRQPCRFGKEVSFSPPVRFVPFSKSPIIADLIERTNAKRRQY
jgi:hypothetical protein